MNQTIETSFVAAVAVLADKPQSVWQLRWRRLLSNRAAILGAAVLILLVLFAAGAPIYEKLMGVDVNDTDLLNRFSPPSAQHLLGTDDAGRDVLARLMYGGRISLLVGLLGAVSAAMVGTLIGLIAGYYRGRTESILMRITDGVISLPILPLLIVFAAIDLQKLGFSEEFVRSSAANFYRIVFIIALVEWTTVARLVRASTLSLMTREYVLAARTQGASARHILSVHILPNTTSPIIVALSLAVGQIILLESTLSFLGLGIQPPTPSWGNMLNNAQELITRAPELAFYPGFLIFITVIAVNFVGDGLQDAFDPRADSH
ncbi:MAG: ABC transporter permease [Candidatus Saccharibacteria bacterium]|nr:ABC transporter permease [Rhodoferax sp.]